MEPTGEVFSVDSYHEIDLAVIPGVAFDRHGARLGRGKGYYDRLLSLMLNAYKIGICFPFQLLEHIPSEPHDVLMNEVVSGTER
jgi:5-formyltetrahydrofolate cyclo-ligase